MTAFRILARISLVAVAPLLPVAVAATPAYAHGAMSNPISRVVACGPDGGQNASSAACKAAVAANGAQAFTDWDNLRVANVAGRDRQLIPDGKLCSGGLAAYKGLDLPRTDWPATKLAAGANFTFTYRETIPHKGTFRLYMTNDSYDPSKTLTWSNLASTPMLTATDPVLTGGAYVMKGRLPTGRTGRQLIYTVWQNSSTADTYYSCSDVIFTAAAQSAGPGAGAAGGAAGTSAGQSPVADNSAAAVAVVGSQNSAGGPGGGASSAVPLAATGAAVLVVAAVVGVFLLRRRSAIQLKRESPFDAPRHRR